MWEGEVSAAGLSNRLDRLEQAAQPSERVVVISEKYGETAEQAESRWLTENPGQTLSSSDLIVILKSFWPEEDED
jgi:hypothetical protein